jgi:isochorismate pyruvate lyase
MTLKSPQDITTMTELRGQIDELDRQLLKLLSVRQAHIDRAAAIKPAIGLPARIDARVEEVVSNVEALAKSEGFDPQIAAQMWRLMVDGMIAREERAMSDKTV